MKQCPKCNLDHSLKGTYCSRKCANSRTFSESSKLKKREANLKHLQSLDQNVIGARMAKMRSEAIKKAADRMQSAAFDTLGEGGRRQRVFVEQAESCLQCKLSIWQGQKINLELDHIDGNRQNNSRDNLRGLCPNCHSLTPTWRGRNKQDRRPTLVTDEEFIAALKCSKNIRQALLLLNLAPKGGHYSRAYRLLELIGERGGTRTHDVLSQED